MTVFCVDSLVLAFCVDNVFVESHCCHFVSLVVRQLSSVVSVFGDLLWLCYVLLCLILLLNFGIW